MRLIGLEFRRRSAAFIWAALAALIACGAVFAVAFGALDAARVLAWMPAECIRAFGIDASASGMTAAAGLSYLVCAVAGSLFACFLGGYAIASETGDGTIEFLYSKPVSRFQIFLSKWVVCLALEAFFALLACAGTWALLRFAFPSLTEVTVRALNASAAVFILCLFFMSASMFFSSVFNSGIVSTIAGLIVLIASVALGMTGLYFERMAAIAVWAPFACLSVFDAAVSGVTFLYAWTYGGVSVLLLAVSALIFLQKDLVS